MRHADRLLQIVQVLRRHRSATTAKVLASELEVSLRTIYRDIADLQTSNVPISGEPGVGYILRPGYDLPPMMFSVEEIEAIVLGTRLVVERGDALLAVAALDVLAKVATVVPGAMSEQVWTSALFVRGRSPEATLAEPFLPLIRSAIREHQKLRVRYVDDAKQSTERVIWPLGLAFYSHVTLVYTWCEWRCGFRAFRADRIESCQALEELFNGKNGALLKEFVNSQRPDGGAADGAVQADV